MMNRMLMFGGTTLGGYAGWWLGEVFGFGFMGCFLISSVGSLVGVYVAWRILVDYLE